MISVCIILVYHFMCMPKMRSWFWDAA